MQRFNLKFVHSFIHAISIAPLQVLYYSEAQCNVMYLGIVYKVVIYVYKSRSRLIRFATLCIAC